MIPLLHAYLCLDDETVFDGGSSPRVCPTCAGRYVVPIARWLNRPLVLSPREVQALSPMERLRQTTLTAGVVLDKIAAELVARHEKKRRPEVGA